MYIRNLINKQENNSGATINSFLTLNLEGRWLDCLFNKWCTYLKIINTLYQNPNLKLHFIFKHNNSFKNPQYLKIMSRNLNKICHESILLQNKWKIVTCIKHLKSSKNHTRVNRFIHHIYSITCGFIKCNIHSSTK